MTAVIGILVSLLLPAVQSARETARRASCVNKMRQIGHAAQTFHAARGRFPSGAVAQEYAEAPATPWTFYRWSALAMLAPYLEERQAFDALDMERPLYEATLGVSPENRQAVEVMLPLFLCPSDWQRRVSPQFGPTNYALSTGSGGAGGSPIDSDGVFGVNSRTAIEKIEDGTSHTVLLSESLLGIKGEEPHDVRREYKTVLAAPLTEGLCRAARSWNVADPRGFAWVNGEFRCALYNHYFTPNAAVFDCIGTMMGGPPATRFTPYGWRAARSDHPGGVNVAYADNSLRFMTDDVDGAIWKAISTIRGGEIKSGL